MKLYTEEQVKMLLEKMSLVTERDNLGVSHNFRHRAIEIGKLLKDISPIELPSDEEIEEGLFHQSNEYAYGYKDAFKWMREQILNQNK